LEIRSSGSKDFLKLTSLTGRNKMFLTNRDRIGQEFF
jgi:hypothetical protein